MRGKTIRRTEIWIPRFQGDRSEFYGDTPVWEGTAELFIEGDLEEFDATGGTITCIVSLPRTEIALSDTSYQPETDGTINLERGERQSINWHTPLGQAKLIDNYVYHNESVGADQALVRIQRCQIVIEGHRTGTTSLGGIALELEDILEAPLELLCLLSEKRIGWYEAQLTFLAGGDASPKFRNATVRRKVFLGRDAEKRRDRHEHELLIKKQFLQEGLFHKLVDNYARSPARNLISGIIPPLLVSRSGGYIETEVALGYSVLENLVSSLGEDIENRSREELKALDELASKLATVVASEIADQKKVKGITDGITAELKRRPISDRLFQLVKKYDLGVTKLMWPHGLGMTDEELNSELKGIYKRRNGYVHKGKIWEYPPYVRDLWRMQRLAELCILKLLDCPVDAINTDALTLISKSPIKHRAKN